VKHDETHLRENLRALQKAEVAALEAQRDKAKEPESTATTSPMETVKAESASPNEVEEGQVT
jgi:hypothetical protein